MENPEKCILCVGLVCMDIITVVDHYPEEDSDGRCIDQIWQRGGNASNSCTAISVVGGNPEYLGVIADTMEQKFLSADFKKFGINFDQCVLNSDVQTPSATILSNTINGSRTILACQRNLPEVTYDEFKKLDLHKNQYKWIHFEGRPSVHEMKAMLKHIDEYNSGVPKQHRITTSVELEKRRENLVELSDKADVVFISKEFALWHGYNDMLSAVNGLWKSCRPGATIICPWGEKGAAAKSIQQTLSSPSFPPSTLVDTIAAGDTFIGSTITALSRGLSLESSLKFGCQVAGAKCGMRGWDDMMNVLTPILKETFKENR